MTPTYGLLVRQADRSFLGALTRWDGLTMIPRFNDVGTWTVQVSLEDPVARDLLDLVLDGPSDVGLVVTRDGDTIISGPLNEAKETVGGTEAGRGSLSLSGYCDNQYLAERLAYQVPTSSAILQTASPYDAITAAAETALHHYVRANAGPNALSYRQVSGLTFAADQARGGTVVERARMDSLLEVAQRIALAADLGFRITHDLDLGALVFEVYDPEDKTADVILSRQLYTLAGYERTITRPKATALVVGGNGDLTARVFGEAVNATAQGRWSRIEEFSDQQGTDATSELTDQGETDLREASEQESVTVSVRDTAACQFGRDYRLGDRISVHVGEQTFQQVIREVELSVGSGEQGGFSQANENAKGRTERVRILVGTPRTKLQKTRTGYAIRVLGTKVAGLERRR